MNIAKNKFRVHKKPIRINFLQFMKAIPTYSFILRSSCKDGAENKPKLGVSLYSRKLSIWSWLYATQFSMKAVCISSEFRKLKSVPKNSPHNFYSSWIINSGACLISVCSSVSSRRGRPDVGKTLLFNAFWALIAAEFILSSFLFYTLKKYTSSIILY